MAKAHTQPCPIAQMLNLVGDRWTLLIIREAFYGATRFTDFQRRTGIARNVLSERLGTLNTQGLLTRSDSGPRPAYALTDKGRSLQTVLVAMFQWGDDHLFGAGRAPVQVIDQSTGRPVARLAVTSDSGAPLSLSDLAVTFRAPLPSNTSAPSRSRKEKHAQSH